MRQCLSLRNGAILVAILLFVAVGIAYAIEIQKGVSGSFAIGRVQTAGETILVWKSLTPAKEPLTQLEFGTGDVDAFGFFVADPRITVWVENAGGIPFKLGLEAIEVNVNGVPGTGGVLSLLMGPPNGELRPSPDNATVINRGDLVPFEVGQRLLKAPEEFGIGTSSRITFTALFRAEAPVPAFNQWMRFIKSGVFENSDTYIPTLRDFGNFDRYVPDNQVLIGGDLFDNSVVGFRTWIYSDGEVSLSVGIAGDDGVALYVNGELIAARQWKSP